MNLGRVVGTATSTVKHASMNGAKLLIVQRYQVDGVTPDEDPVLVIDTLGAGRGTMVMITSDGPEAGKLLGDDRTPVRWSVQGIVDP